MSLSQTVAELGLIIKGVLYLFLRPFGASSIQERLIIARIRYIFAFVMICALALAEQEIGRTVALYLSKHFVTKA